MDPQDVAALGIPVPLGGEYPMGPRRTVVFEALRKRTRVCSRVNLAGLGRELDMNEGTLGTHVVQLAAHQVVRIFYAKPLLKYGDGGKGVLLNPEDSGKRYRHIVCGDAVPVLYDPRVHNRLRHPLPRYRVDGVGRGTRAYYLFEVSFTVTYDGEDVVTVQSPFMPL
jgi:hypothetical protein